MATPAPAGTLSYPPLPGPIAGIYAVNAPWAQWFRELWNRVGGPDAPTNTELHTLIMSQAPGGPVDTATLLETVGDFFVQQGSGQEAAAGAQVADMSGRLDALEVETQDTAPALLSTLQRRLDDLEAFVLSAPGIAVPPAAVSTITGLWNWSTLDGTGDPGAPNAAFDTAALPLALRISRQTLDNHDASAMLATVQPGDMLTIQSPSVSTIWVRFNVNAALSHFPTYFSYPGTVLATGAGGQPTANMPVTLTLTRMAGLEDAGSDTETPFIRTALDLDNRVAALENLPLDSVTQSVNDLRSRMEAVEAPSDTQAQAIALDTLHKRLDDLEAFVLANQSAPAPVQALSTMTALWNWSTVDDPFAGDPGAPNAAFDVALAPLNLRVARRTLDNRDASAMLATVQPGDVWTIESPSVSTIWVRFEVNTALRHFPTYFTYPGTVLATGAGGQPTANMPVTLTLTRMAGLEDAGSDTETPFIRTALDLDNRVAALENLPLDSVTQSVNDLRSRMEAVEAPSDTQAQAIALDTLHKRLDDLEAFVLANQSAPAPVQALSTMTALWNWSTVDDPFAGDPGAPNAAFDVALAPLNLRVARRTLDNRDASAILATVQPGDVWTIESPSVSTIWVRFEVNTALSHFPTYFTYPGTVLATGAGGQPTANMPVTLTLTRMAGLEDAGSDTETPFIRTALDLDNRVAALENLPLDSVTQSVNDLRSRMEAVEAPSDTQAQAIALDTLHKRLDDLEAFVLANQSAPAPVQALSTMTALWNWSTVDDPFAGDPGAPNAAFDVALAPLNLRVARRTLDNRDASAMLATVQPGDVWTIESPSVSTIWVRFEVNTALRHFPTYFTYPGTVLATGAGGQPTANMPVTLTLTRMAGLEDAGSDTETPFIRTALDLDNRVAALENLPLDSVTQS